ncbi:MAG: response regulator [Nitrospirae bacterium]|nr:response regulator [Nitrospirota bacterium]
MERIKILVIDDEQTIVNSFIHYFSKRSYEITGITSSEDALVFIAQEPFDVIITDLHMSPVTGFELIDVVRRVNPKALLIVMSGRYGAEDVKGLNIDYFFEKPFVFKKIETCIKERFVLSKSA